MKSKTCCNETALRLDVLSYGPKRKKRGTLLQTKLKIPFTLFLLYTCSRGNSPCRDKEKFSMN